MLDSSVQHVVGAKKEFVLSFFIFIFGMAMGGALTQAIGSFKDSQNKEVREIGDYAFISPLLECESGRTISQGLVPFSDELMQYVERVEKRVHLEDLAVYYRDLNNGPWAGINEDQNFIPASLLKVPIMLAYFKVEEEQPPVLSQTLLFKKMFDYPLGREQTIVSKEEIVVGNTYTIAELIKRMITYSDNQATWLLLENLNYKWLTSVRERMGIKNNIFGQGAADAATISVKDYASFFRILYNASFLNRVHSEKALEILSQSAYKDGLPAGVPKSIVLAHKFGESGSVDSFLQLHDCGIVYHPIRPYLLCIMTKGTNIQEMTTAIKDISKFVFEAVDAQVK